MILKTVENKNGVANQFVLESNEPVTLELIQSETGHLVVYVYKGIGNEVSEYTEPTIVFDSDATPKVLKVENKTRFLS